MRKHVLLRQRPRDYTKRRTCSLLAALSHLHNCQSAHCIFCLQPMASRPGIGCIVLIHPEQNVGAAPVWMGNDGSILVSDANGTHPRVLSHTNGLVIERRMGRILKQPGHALLHMRLSLCW